MPQTSKINGGSILLSGNPMLSCLVCGLLSNGVFLVTSIGLAEYALDGNDFQILPHFVSC